MGTITDELARAADHLQASDNVMANLIAKVGPCTLRFERNRFRMLVRSIIGQQLSARAARTIRERFDELVGSKRYAPENVAALSIAQVRSVGMSANKASFIIELAAGVADGRVVLNQLGRLGNDEIVQELTQIRGVGRWTAHMFLIFSIGRLDVLPYDDMGVRGAIRRFYDLEDVPDTNIMTKIAMPWRPYASVASWYCWQALDRGIGNGR